MLCRFCPVAVALIGCLSGLVRAETPEIQRIWDSAEHSAFTDLARYKGRLWCVFREASKHVSDDGVIRVLVSKDGERWQSAAHLESAEGDLRDPKITTTPKGELMLTAAIAYRDGVPARHQTLAWFSKNGVQWSDPVKIGDPNYWLWRVSWNKVEARSLAYSTAGGTNRFYKSSDGKSWTDAGSAPTECRVNESTIRYAANGTEYILERRESCDKHAVLRVGGTDKPLDAQIGGPNLLLLPDGRLLGAGRLYDGKQRMSLFWIDPESGHVGEFEALPSGGDCSYPGLVLHRGTLWVSYYSSHEGKTAIYIAKLKLPAKTASVARR